MKDQKKCYYDYSNESFNEMSKVLKMAGVKNNTFMLETSNPDLIGVDPYATDLTSDMQNMIRKECKRNIWYFLRYIKLPDYSQAKCNPVLLCIAYCFQHNINLYLNSTRYSSKTTSMVQCSVWNNRLPTKFNGNPGLVRLIISAQKDIRNSLPEYLKKAFPYNENECCMADIYDDAEFTIRQNTNDKLVYEKLKNSKKAFDEFGKDKTSLFMMLSTVNRKSDSFSLLTLRHFYHMDWLELFDKNPDDLWFAYIALDPDRLGWTNKYMEDFKKLMHPSDECFDSEIMLKRDLAF